MPPRTPEKPAALTVEQVARRLQIGEDDVLELIRSGKLRGLRIVGVGWRIPVRSLEALMEGADEPAGQPEDASDEPPGTSPEEDAPAQQADPFARLRATLADKLPAETGWRWYYDCWWRLRELRAGVWYGVIAGFVKGEETVLAAVAERQPDGGLFCRPARTDSANLPLSEVYTAVAEAYAAAEDMAGK
jgi:excisionase family DNA binding protein